MSMLWPKYENWSKLGKQNRVYRYTLNVYRYTLASGGVYRYTTVHVPVHLPKFAQIVYFIPFFHTFDTQFNSILHIHLKTISYSFCNLFSIQFLFQYLSLLQKSIMNYSQITLIWVMTHTQTKYKDLLGFVLTQLFYLAINP